jgi:hypothetical protein
MKIKTIFTNFCNEFVFSVLASRLVEYAMQICLIQLLIGAAAKLFMQAGLQEVCARNDAHSMKVLNVYLLVCWSVKGPVGGRATCNISLAVTQTCSSSFHDRRMGKKNPTKSGPNLFSI